MSSILDFARTVVKGHSAKGLNAHSVYDVEIEALNLSYIRNEIKTTPGDEWSRAESDQLLNIMEQWGKRSFLRLPIPHKDGYVTEAGLLIGHRGDMSESVLSHRGWSAGVAITDVPGDWNNDLIQIFAMLVIFTGLDLMGSIMRRPTEYRLSRGIRNHYERLHNMPAVITISLSQPVVHVIGSHPHGGGWRMPEHEVRGHERHYKSGKVVWVKGHTRGDPHVQRRTTYKVIP